MSGLCVYVVLWPKIENINIYWQPVQEDIKHNTGETSKKMYLRISQRNRIHFHFIELNLIQIRWKGYIFTPRLLCTTEWVQKFKKKNVERKNIENKNIENKNVENVKPPSRQGSMTIRR